MSSVTLGPSSILVARHIYVSPLLVLRLQHVGKHFPLPLLTSYAVSSL